MSSIATHQARSISRRHSASELMQTKPDYPIKSEHSKNDSISTLQKQKINSLTSRIRSLTDQKNSYLQKLSEQSKESKNLKVELKKAKMNLNKSRKEFEKQRKQRDRQLKSLDSNLSGKDKELRNLKEKFSLFEKERIENYERISAMSTQIRLLEEKASVFEEENEELKKENKALLEKNINLTEKTANEKSIKEAQLKALENEKTKNSKEKKEILLKYTQRIKELEEELLKSSNWNKSLKVELIEKKEELNLEKKKSQKTILKSESLVEQNETLLGDNSDIRVKSEIRIQEAERMLEEEIEKRRVRKKLSSRIRSERRKVQENEKFDFNYLKNVIVKFLIYLPLNENNAQQLLPVIASLMELSEDEKSMIEEAWSDFFIWGLNKPIFLAKKKDKSGKEDKQT